MSNTININSNYEEYEGGFQKRGPKPTRMNNGRQDATRSQKAKAESASRRYSDEQIAAKQAANKKIAAQKAADNKRAVIAQKRENSGMDKKSSYSFNSGRNGDGRRR